MDFKNRKDAGERLIEALMEFKEAPDCIAIGLPRGGVVIAKIVKDALKIPLDVIVPRKIGAPNNPEFAIGAIAGDELFLDPEIIETVKAPQSYIDSVVEEEKKEAERRLALYRKNRPPQDFSGKTILLIDDGIATGATIRASLLWLKKKGAKKIVIAVPVAPRHTIDLLKKEADQVICLSTPEPFMAVGQFYEDFPQTTDDEVIALLE